MTDPPKRLARAGVAAGVATALGAVGHVLAGGSTGAGPLLLAFGAAVAAIWPLTSRERGWATIAVVQIAVQAAVHVALGWNTVEHHHAAAAVPDDVMVYAHLAAGLLTAALLRLGEHRVWAAARRAAARWARWWSWLAAVPTAGPPHVRPHVVVTQVLRSEPVLLRHVLVRRGPPVGC